MKKLFLGLGAAALIMSSVSCGSGNKNSAAGNDSCVVNNDSLAIALGASMGGDAANRISQMPDTLPYKTKLSKDDIIKGLEYVLSIDTANVGISAGVSMGVQLAFQIAQMEQMGAKIDRKKVIEEFSKALKQDSVSMEDLNKYQLFINISDGKLRAEAHRKYMEELEKKPEAIQGTKTGESFINELKKNDAEIKTTASGLSYKIINEGAGDKAVDTSFVQIKYTGKLINDTVFDDTKGKAVEFPVKGVVPGFSEGLKLLGKGGKAIFYIPGKLGYGAQGQPAAGIGPNATLIFEVEVVDIKGTATPQKPQNPVNFQGQPRPNVKVQGKK